MFRSPTTIRVSSYHERSNRFGWLIKFIVYLSFFMSGWFAQSLLRSHHSSTQSDTDDISQDVTGVTTHKLKVNDTSHLLEKSQNNQCFDQLDHLQKQSELQATQIARLNENLHTRNELLKLAQFSALFNQDQVTLGQITVPMGTPSHEAFSVCFPITPKTPIKEGDLVAAQGALLGEVALVADRCVTVRPTVSELSSFEVRFAQSGLRGVAVGLGTQAGEETVGASMKLKYLERFSPAIPGEQVYLMMRPRSSSKTTMTQTTNENFKSFPALIVGEVLQAEIKENGLFQDAKITSPLRRSAVKWVSVISLPH